MDMANNGEDIILKSRKNGSFKLVPVSESDMLISKEYILEPGLALKSLVLIIIIIFCFMGFICKYSKKEIGIQFGRILSLKEAKRNFLFTIFAYKSHKTEDYDNN